MTATGYVTLSNILCNLYCNKIARQVAQNVAYGNGTFNKQLDALSTELQGEKW